MWEKKRNRETWTKVFIFLFKVFKEWLDYTRILTETKGTDYKEIYSYVVDATTNSKKSGYK